MNTRHLQFFILTVSATAILSCSEESSGRRDPSPEPPSETEIRINPDWSIYGPERETVTENGFKTDIDIITVESSDNESYWLDLIMEDNFTQTYGKDMKAYLEDELNILAGIVESNGTSFEVETVRGNSTTNFNRLRSGKWRAVAFGVTSDGKLTGDYQTAILTVVPDKPSDDFNNWLGDWVFEGTDITDRNKAVSYNVHFSSSDPDYYFTVSGWETGEGLRNDMSDYTFEARYDRFTKTVLFMGQYLETYSDANGTFDFGFYGNFYYDGKSGFTDMSAGEYALTESVIVAEAFRDKNDADKASIEALNLDFNHGGKIYSTVFTSMQYYDLPTDSNEAIAKYNDNVPAFPISMTRKTGTNNAAPKAVVPEKALKIKATRFSGSAVRSMDSGVRRTSVSSAKAIRVN